MTRVKSEFNVSYTPVKFKIYPNSNISHRLESDHHQFNHNFFIQSVWYLGSDRRAWYDSRSDHCKKLKVDFKADGTNLNLFCNSLPSELTGDGVLLLKRNVNTEITNISTFPRSNITVADK